MKNNNELRKQSIKQNKDTVMNHYNKTDKLDELIGFLNGLNAIDLNMPEIEEMKNAIIKKINSIKNTNNNIEMPKRINDTNIDREVSNDENDLSRNKGLILKNINNSGFVNILYIIISIIIIVIIITYLFLVNK